MMHLQLHAVVTGARGPVADNPALAFTPRERTMGAAELAVLFALAWIRAMQADGVMRRSKPHHENVEIFASRVRAVARIGPADLQLAAHKLGERLGLRSGWLGVEELFWLRYADTQPGRHIAGLLSDGATLALVMAMAATAREYRHDAPTPTADGPRLVLTQPPE